MPELSETDTRTDKTRLTGVSPFIDPESSLPELELPPLILLEPTRRSIQNHALLKTPQQRYSEEIQTTLTVFPDVLIRLVIDYAPVEPYLAPFSLNKFGEPIRSESAGPILESLFAAFIASHSRSALVRKEIIQYHTRAVLDPIIKAMFSPEKNSYRLKRILSGDLRQAVSDRNSRLRVVARYLPTTTCEQLISDELIAIGKLETDTPCADLRPVVPDNELALRRLNLDLFIDILRHEANTVPLGMAKSPDGYQLDLMLIRVKTNIISKNYRGAHHELLDAFDLACKSRDKRRVIDIGFQLIDLARLRHVLDFMDVFHFALQIRELCQLYPADYDLYVDLVFKMDGFAQERSRPDLQLQLFRDAIAATKVSTAPCVPARYSTKLVYGYTKLQCTKDPHPSHQLKCLFNALKCFHKIHHKHHFYAARRHGGAVIREPKGSRFSDVSLPEFLRQFSSLYQMVARVADIQINLVSVMSAEQRALFSSLSRLCLSMDQSLSYDLGTTGRLIESAPYVLLQHNGATMAADFTRHQLIQLTAECLKNALKIMLDTSTEEFHSRFDNLKPDESGLAITSVDQRPFHRDATHWPPFLATFDELVRLYLKHGMLDQLSELISKKHTDSYISIPGFSDKLAIWLTSLQERLSESERSRPTPAKRQKIHAGT